MAALFDSVLLGDCEASKHDSTQTICFDAAAVAVTSSLWYTRAEMDMLRLFVKT